MLIEINERGLKKLYFANREITAADFSVGLAQGHTEYQYIEIAIQKAIQNTRKVMASAQNIVKYEVLIEVGVWN